MNECNARQRSPWQNTGTLAPNDKISVVGSERFSRKREARFLLFFSTHVPASPLVASVEPRALSRDAPGGAGADGRPLTLPLPNYAH